MFIVLQLSITNILLVMLSLTSSNDRVGDVPLFQPSDSCFTAAIISLSKESLFREFINDRMTNLEGDVYFLQPKDVYELEELVDVIGAGVNLHIWQKDYLFFDSIQEWVDFEDFRQINGGFQAILFVNHLSGKRVEGRIKMIYKCSTNTVQLKEVK